MSPLAGLLLTAPNYLLALAGAVYRSLRDENTPAA